MRNSLPPFYCFAIQITHLRLNINVFNFYISCLKFNILLFNILKQTLNWNFKRLSNCKYCDSLSEMAFSLKQVLLRHQLSPTLTNSSSHSNSYSKLLEDLLSFLYQHHLPLFEESIKGSPKLLVLLAFLKQG